MPRATLGLLAIVLWGCAPEGELSSADSDVAARRGHHDRQTPWNPPRKGPRWHGPSHHDDDGHDDSPTAADLLMCVEACNADEDDDDCHDDHHWWRHSGNRPDTQEECQALWDSLDDTERSAALDDARDALDECGVEAGGTTCESFTAVDDNFTFFIDAERPPATLPFDVFAGGLYDEFVDTAEPAGSGMVVDPDSTGMVALDVELAANGMGAWSDPVQFTSRQFNYTACCTEPDGSNSGVCDTAMVTLQAC